MNRSSSRRTDTTRRIRPLWLGLLALLCGWAFMACAGGSGSSGFDLALKAENDAIDRALGADDCQVNDGLTICASGGSPTATATARATATTTGQPPLTTPTASLTAGPIDTTRTPTPSPFGGSPTPSLTPSRSGSSPTPTATAIPAAPGVETNISSPEDTIPCQETSTGGPCVFLFMFQPQGAPSTAAYRVAVRTRNPDGSWQILPVVNDSALITVDPNGPDYQIAVLLYVQDPAFVPDHVELLADSGATFAFVTPVLTPDMLLVRVGSRSAAAAGTLR